MSIQTMGSIFGSMEKELENAIAREDYVRALKLVDFFVDLAECQPAFKPFHEYYLRLQTVLKTRIINQVLNE